MVILGKHRKVCSSSNAPRDGMILPSLACHEREASDKEPSCAHSQLGDSLRVLAVREQARCTQKLPRGESHLQTSDSS